MYGVYGVSHNAHAHTHTHNTFSGGYAPSSIHSFITCVVLECHHSELRTEHVGYGEERVLHTHESTLHMFRDEGGGGGGDAGRKKDRRRKRRGVNRLFIGVNGGYL